MAKSCFIRTKLSPAPSAPCSSVSPNSARHVGFGSGFDPKVYLFHCKRCLLGCLARSAGSLRPTTHSIKSSSTRYMLALTPTARPDTNATSMNTAPSRNAFGISPWISGPYSSWIIIRASSIGLPSRPTRRGLIPTHGQSRINQERAERRYRAVEPENRLVARGLETEWENRLRDLAAAETELRRREQQRPNPMGPEQLQRIQMLGSDIRQVWTAPAITDRDRKELLRTLLEEVIFNLKRVEGRAHLTLRWRGGAITVLDVPVPRFKPMGPRTDEDTISLLRRLATLYPDEVIAGILNRQGRKTATGERFTANQ